MTPTTTRPKLPVRAHVYDNGGESADRYVIIPTAKRWTDRGETTSLFLSDDCNSPSGVAMWNYVPARDADRSYLGKRIAFSDLPEQVQRYAATAFLDD